jgi:formate dehydrogenase iron-sulfur subunit
VPITVFFIAHDEEFISAGRGCSDPQRISILRRRAAQHPKGEERMSKSILYDATMCIGCLECQRGCAESNALPYDDKIAAEQKTSEHKFTSVVQNPDGTFMRRMCMHCADPSCASVCPVGALQKTQAGPVIYHVEKCMGCRYCMVACPFGIPKYEWTKLLPGVRKCTMCYARLAEGKVTACTEACPTGATTFGNRDELVAEGHRRMRENPTGYINHILGEREVGGTSVLFISAVPFEKFGFKPSYTPDRLPDTTYRVLSKIPDITVLGGVLLGGVWWITNRRTEVALSQFEDKKDRNKPVDEPKGGES